MPSAIDPRIPGGRYRSGYYGDEYVVIERTGGEFGQTTWFLVQWSDGGESKHCTAWDGRRDRIMSHPDISDGLVFDTEYEKGCVVRTSPDWRWMTDGPPRFRAYASFEADDSEGVTCSFGVNIITRIYPPCGSCESREGTRYVGKLDEYLCSTCRVDGRL